MGGYRARLAVSGLLFSVGVLLAGSARAQSLAGWERGVSSMNAGGAQDSAAGMGVGERPTADEIIARMLEKNRERLAALDHYTSERTYRVDYTGTGGSHHAEMRVHAEYTGPNRKRLTVVEESGPKFLCEKVLRKLVESEQEASESSNQMQTTLGPENYDAELVGEESVPDPGGRAGEGARAWVLLVKPKVDNKFTYRGRIWVSQDDYAVMRVEGEPAKNPSWWVNRASFDSRYLRRGEVWLPAQNRSTSHVRIGGEATLTIDYGTYPVVVARALQPAPETVASFSH